VRAVDKAWTAMLLPLGIAKGKAFDPDARQQRILLAGAAMGELRARNLQVNPRYAEPYWKNTRWYKCFDFTIPQETDTCVELDERITWFVYFRLYAPLQAFFDKTYSLADFEMID